MKRLSCDLCDEIFEAETFEEWLQLLMPHYMNAHSDFMEASKNKPKEAQMEWMAINRARFEAAEEV